MPDFSVRKLFEVDAEVQEPELDDQFRSHCYPLLRSSVDTGIFGCSYLQLFTQMVSQERINLIGNP
ncbi:hypothetical protein O9993_12470 [Vibrio lentus]|nr:hypothetical protein [Vibrio lentus]